MMPPDRQLDGADEIGAWIERLWRVHRNRRVGFSARAVRYSMKRRGLPAERIGRNIVADSVAVTAWWAERTATKIVSVGGVVAQAG